MPRYFLRIFFNQLFWQLIIALTLLLINYSVQAKSKKLPIPRFVTIKFNEVNARTGASKDCPIEWIFIKKSEPVQVIAEFEQWRRIRDINNQGGWVHASTISGNRAVIILGKKLIPLCSRPQQINSNYVAKLSPSIRCGLKKCEDNWCYLTCKSYSGWVEKKYLWGV